ncbi:mercury transporter [Sulfurifustis variabilis]|uniref:Periplasmic mercury ion-binding protein n=1 Tax=Sulfurifustis variabilis TaxID=1675686 RepID=A0A1B4VCS9_9GAMM|nr:mercury resistance system periplasmic binding protein MerP [Sulfurifustis variabilis]BAU49701.1 mercury transporter [Sulfurifustis variabilis]
MYKSLLTALLLFALVPTPTPSAAAADAPGARTVTLAVENMTCAACPITVRRALRKVPGVAAVEVDLETRTAMVTFDPAKTNVETLTRATTEAGYPSTLQP